MSSEIIQVRDVPSSDVEVLRARAASLNMSVSGYLRALIHDDASRPTMAMVLERIGGRTPVPADNDDIRDLIDAERR